MSSAPLGTIQIEEWSQGRGLLVQGRYLRIVVAPPTRARNRDHVKFFLHNWVIQIAPECRIRARCPMHKNNKLLRLSQDIRSVDLDIVNTAQRLNLQVACRNEGG
jgi:hypothetical protein